MGHCIVAGTDGSHASVQAVGWAAREAQARGAELRLVHAAPPGSPAAHAPRTPHPPGGTPGPGPEGKGAGGEEQGAELMLRRTVSHLVRARPGLRVTAHVSAGAPAGTLAEECRSAELLVLGTRGLEGFDGLRLGSVALEAAGRAPCPVVLVPPDAQARSRTGEVALGFDARRPDSEVTAFALDAAHRRGSGLCAVHAWRLDSPGAAGQGPFGLSEEERGEREDAEVQLLEAALRPWREKYPGLPIRGDVRLLSPAGALVSASRRADLLVVGRGGGTDREEGGEVEGGGRGAWLAAVPHAVAHHTRCPLALVPSR